VNAFITDVFIFFIVVKYLSTSSQHSLHVDRKLK